MKFRLELQLAVPAHQIRSEKIHLNPNRAALGLKARPFSKPDSGAIA
jgi:hypothetical protein